jgi:hypothetical protein
LREAAKEGRYEGGNYSRRKIIYSLLLFSSIISNLELSVCD